MCYFIQCYLLLVHSMIDHFNPFSQNVSPRLVQGLYACSRLIRLFKAYIPFKAYTLLMAYTPVHGLYACSTLIRLLKAYMPVKGLFNLFKAYMPAQGLYAC